MKIRCECGCEFTTPDHDDVINFSSEAVVGPLGPDTVRDQVVVSENQACPDCKSGRYITVTLEMTHLEPEQRAEFEQFMLRLHHGDEPEED